MKIKILTILMLSCLSIGHTYANEDDIIRFSDFVKLEMIDEEAVNEIMSSKNEMSNSEKLEAIQRIRKDISSLEEVINNPTEYDNKFTIKVLSSHLTALSLTISADIFIFTALFETFKLEKDMPKLDTKQINKRRSSSLKLLGAGGFLLLVSEIYEAYTHIDKTLQLSVTAVELQKLKETINTYKQYIDEIANLYNEEQELEAF